MFTDVFQEMLQTSIKSHWSPSIQMDYDDTYPRIFLSCQLFDKGNLDKSIVRAFVLFFGLTECEAIHQFNHAVQVCLDAVGFSYTNYYFDQRSPEIHRIASKDFMVMVSDYNRTHKETVCDLFVSELFQFREKE